MANPDIEGGSITNYLSSSSGGPEQPEGQAGGPPDVARRRRLGDVLVVVLPILLVAAVTGGAIAYTSKGSDRDPNLTRFDPLELGETWAYATTRNGKDTGPAWTQVVGTARTGNGQPGVVTQNSFQNFQGSGRPFSFMSYVSAGARRDVDVGDRLFGHFFGEDPPDPLLQSPIRAGTTWTYSGTAFASKTTRTYRITGFGNVRAAGRTFHGCVHVAIAISTISLSTGKPEPETETEDLCPGVGLVRSHDVNHTTGVVSDTVLTAFHGPGLNIGQDRSAAPVSSASLASGTGSVPEIDDGRTNAVPGAVLDTDHLAWSLARKNSILYPPVGSRGLAVLAEDDGTVSATDTRTGRVLWQVQLDGPIVAPPVLAGPVVLVADSSRSLFALDTATGLTRWVTTFPDQVSTAPVVAGGTIVTAEEDQEVRGLDPATGRIRWSTGLSAIATFPPAASGDVVVVEDRTGGLTALDGRTGDQLWSGGLDFIPSEGVVAAGGLVLASQEDGKTEAFGLRDGALKWVSIPHGGLDFAPSVSGDRVVMEAGHVLEAHDLATGRQLWTARLSLASDGPAVILGNTVAVLLPDAVLDLFDLRTGRAEGVVHLPAPEPGSSISTDLFMSYVDSTLVVPIHSDGPWPFTELMAYPAPVPGQGSPPSRSGVRLEGIFVPIPDDPLDAPHLAGVDLFISGLLTHGIYDVSLSGPTAKLFSSSGVSPFAVPAGRFVLAQDGTDLVAIPRSGGAPAWRFPMGPLRVGTEPVVLGNDVLVPLSTGLAEVSLASGHQLWSVKLTGSGSGTPLVLPNGDIAYTGAGVSVVDPRTHKAVWSLSSISAAASPAFADGRLLVTGQVGSQNAIVALDVATGKPLWAKPLGGIAVAPPATADGVVIAEDGSGAVTAFDAASGNTLWSLTMRTPANGAPQIVGNRVAVQEQGIEENVNQRDYRITVLDLRTGRWEASWEFAGSAFIPGNFTSGVLEGKRFLLAQSLGRTGPAEYFLRMESP